MKVPTTCAEVFEAADLPFRQAQVLLGKAGGLPGECFSEIYPNFGFGYLHSSDHYAALLIVLEREPTFREVYDSYHLGGSRNIDLAREKASGGGRPSEWETMTPEAQLYAVLVKVHGIALGSRIFDGKKPDPKPEKTREQMLLWGMKLPGEPAEPPPPLPPPPPPLPPMPLPPAEKDNEMTIQLDGKVRRFRLVEIQGA